MWAGMKTQFPLSSNITILRLFPGSAKGERGKT